MLSLSGYVLNEKYTTIRDVIKELNNSSVLATTTMEAKALLRVLRYLGVKHLVYDIDPALELNLPKKGRKNHVYSLRNYNGEIVVNMTPLALYKAGSNYSSMLKVKDVITNKTLFTVIQDYFCDK